MRKLSLMSILEQAKYSIIEENKKGKMVALFIPKMLGSTIQQIFKDIPGEPVPPGDMHITLGFPKINEEEDNKLVSVLQDLASELNSFDVKIEKFGFFEPNKHNHQKYILWAEPTRERIFHIKDMVFDFLKKHGLNIDNGPFEFNPHITIKYCDQKPEIDRKINNPVFRIKNISFANNGRNFHLPFRG